MKPLLDVADNLQRAIEVVPAEAVPEDPAQVGSAAIHKPSPVAVFLVCMLFLGSRYSGSVKCVLYLAYSQQ